MNTQIYVIIVIYNLNIKNSNSCNSLFQMKYKNVLAVDNSTSDYNNAITCNDYGWHYISMDGNKGLSKAYNAAIDYLRNKTDFIVLLDDDTILPQEYFDRLNETIIKNPDAKIFLPIVRSEVAILSPCRVDEFDVSEIQDISEITKENVSGVNSGMAISMEIFSSYRYDEKYFLDYIDHAFLRDMRKLDIPIVIFDTILYQKFSRNDISNLTKTLNRFKIFKKDFKYFHNRKSLKEKFKTITYLFRYRVVLCRKFKTFIFLWA